MPELGGVDPAIAGLSGALLIAAVAWLAERRRSRRADLDRVGWMPWTPIFLVALLAALLLSGLALKAWLGG